MAALIADDSASAGFSGLLAELLPPALDTHYIVGSGSEANDLAIRIARYATGGKGFVATRRAFHGTTVETAAISPAVGGMPAVAGWVRLVTPSGDGQAFAAAVRNAAYELRDSEYGFAGMIVDPIFSSDGVHPSAGLGDAAEAVHDAGGLFIVDETALTPASVGPAMWAFADGGVTPDILTFIPAAVGEVPLAVVALGSAIEGGPAIDPRRYRGSDVALTAAERSLSSIRDSGAENNSTLVGDYLAAGLALVASVSDAITDVRARGLHLGFDTTRGADVFDALSAHGVIVGRVGPDTLVIDAPLGFSMHDADLLLQRIYGALVALESNR